MYAKRIGEKERRVLRREALERAGMALCPFKPDCSATRKDTKPADGEALTPYERLFEEAKGRQERARARAKQIPIGCTFYPQFTVRIAFLPPCPLFAR